MLLLQIVYPDGTIARFPADKNGKYEINLVASLTKSIMSKPDCIWIDKEERIKEAIEEGMMNFKKLTSNGFTK